MQRYDPLEAPDPEEWLELDEQERIDWFGLGAPKNTPPKVVEKLHNDVSLVLADAKFKARVAELDGTVILGASANFGKLIVDETEKWAKVVKFAGVKAD